MVKQSIQHKMPYNFLITHDYNVLKFSESVNRWSFWQIFKVPYCLTFMLASYVALSSNVRLWGMWVCLLFLSHWKLIIFLLNIVCQVFFMWMHLFFAMFSCILKSQKMNRLRLLHIWFKNFVIEYENPYPLLLVQNLEFCDRVWKSLSLTIGPPSL